MFIIHTCGNRHRYVDALLHNLDYIDTHRDNCQIGDYGHDDDVNVVEHNAHEYHMNIFLNPDHNDNNPRIFEHGKNNDKKYNNNQIYILEYNNIFYLSHVTMNHTKNTNHQNNKNEDFYQTNKNTIYTNHNLC